MDYTTQDKILLTDSSKIQDYLTCPRYFWYRHVLGWTKDIASPHLDFGTSVHAGMEPLMRFRMGSNTYISVVKNNPHRVEEEVFIHYPPMKSKGYNSVSLEEAFNRFLDSYKSFFGNLLIVAPGKSIDAVSEILPMYVENYSQDDFETLHVEVSFRAPLINSGMIGNADPISLHGRMDGIVRTKDGRIWGVEHKTASKLSNIWQNQWSTSVQIGSYTHLLYCMFPPEDVQGVIVNALVFNPTKVQVRRIYVTRSRESMRAWYKLVTDTVTRIYVDLERFQTQVETNNPDIYNTFHMCPTSCGNYGGCEFLEFCVAWPEPLRHIDPKEPTPPPGYKIHYWDPREKEETAKEVIKL
ncbi:MAG: hypothetical protein EHM79_00220 [Geobacter sp.]|nr:MAG: hypothetical protein EHM79_00220 [Geobacter sp.]